MTIINHGEWSTYAPEKLPEGCPQGALFWQRGADGADLYEWGRTAYVQDGGDTSETIKIAVSGDRVACVTNDITRLAPPPTFMLFELTSDEQAPRPGWYFYTDSFSPTREFASTEERRASLENISARQLWLMAKEVGITKASVLASLDTVTDQDEAETLRIELTEPPRDGYERLSPAVEKFRIMQGIPEDHFDDLWAWASQIK